MTSQRSATRKLPNEPLAVSLLRTGCAMGGYPKHVTLFGMTDKVAQEFMSSCDTFPGVTTTRSHCGKDLFAVTVEVPKPKDAREELL